MTLLRAGLLGLSLLAAASRGFAGDAPVLHPERLVVLSTTDVKGKTGPCGCHIPKGGLSRQASFADSIRANFGQVLWLDAGGYFPEEPARRPAARFLLGAMHALGVSAAGVAARDLRYGAAMLVSEAHRADMPLVCANLVDARTRRPLVAPYLVRKVGDVTVGVFGLIGPKANLGPAHDSLAVTDPQEAARATVAALRSKGAEAIVLLSQLGRLDSEDLVATVDGIDALVVGHDAPLFQAGRTIKNTVACYGGEQGQYLCVTELTLDVARHVTDRSAHVVELSPGVGDKAPVLAMVKAFEDGLADTLGHAGATNAAGAAPPSAPGSTGAPPAAPGDKH